MKISNTPLDKPGLGGSASVSGTSPRTNSAASTASAPAPAASATTVSLSPQATQLMTAGASSDFNAAKVAAMQTAIAEGRYKPNADAIADRLLANTRELFTGRPS